MSHGKRPALFLDRDGVINRDHGYVYRQDNFDFIPGIFELCRVAKARDYLIFVITNQAGIGRGMYTERDFLALTRWMRLQFERERCPIDEVYFCPTHPQHGIGKYKRESARRKPNPGMIVDAQRDFGVDLASSVLVGDKASDIEAGVAAGVGCNVLFSESLDKTLISTGLMVHSLAEVQPLLRVHRHDPNR